MFIKIDISMKKAYFSIKDSNNDKDLSLSYDEFKERVPEFSLMSRLEQIYIEEPKGIYKKVRTGGGADTLTQEEITECKKILDKVLQIIDLNVSDDKEEKVKEAYITKVFRDI